MSSSSGGRGLPPRSRWVGIAFIAGILLLAVIVTRTCGAEDVKINDEEAVATAKAAVDFDAERTAVRFVRQGVRSQPYYAVSLSSGTEGQSGYRLTTVLVDARSGEVAEITREH